MIAGMIDGWTRILNERDRELQQEQIKRLIQYCEVQGQEIEKLRMALRYIAYYRLMGGEQAIKYIPEIWQDQIRSLLDDK